MANFPKKTKGALLNSTKSIAPTSVQPWRMKNPAPDAVREKRTVMEPGTKKRPERSVTKWVLPGSKGNLKPCRRPTTKAKKRKPGEPPPPPAPLKPLRSCHVELDWVNAKEAERIGTRPGPHLRFCATKPDAPAPMVRVKDHQEAQELSDQFCACVTKTKDKKQCALDMAGAFSKRGGRRTSRGQAPVFGGDVRGFDGPPKKKGGFRYPDAGTLVKARQL